MLRRISAFLSEAVMGFVALAALGARLAPLLFPLPLGVEIVLDVFEWAIVALFAVEYSVNWSLAADKQAFVLNPWRILDAAIVVVAIASVIPTVSDTARSAPALRILRLIRVLLFGMRAGHGVASPVVPASRTMPAGPPQVTRLSSESGTVQPADWADLLRWAASPESEWIHVSNLAPEKLREAAQAVGVPQVMVEAALHESSYPRLESGPRWAALSLSVPSEGGALRRDPVLLLVAKDDMLSLALHPLDLQRAPEGLAAVPWGPRCALDLVRRILERSEELAGRLEREVRDLESMPADESPERFFEATFRLKRAISTAKGDLWRLHRVLKMLAEGRRTLPGLGAEGRAEAHRLAEEADYLHDTIDNVRESVLSLIDLHINVAAHETNRFMRLVAIVTTLGLIPAIIGGLLGMNLAEAPWPVTLGQIAFVTLFLILGVLYAFMAKGWLR
jgi:Mg2+ and Co2+ transporter CorA